MSTSVSSKTEWAGWLLAVWEETIRSSIHISFSGSKLKQNLSHINTIESDQGPSLLTSNEHLSSMVLAMSCGRSQELYNCLFVEH